MTRSDERPMVRVEDLRVVRARSRTPVVDGVSFEVAAGEVLGLVGESGSGKTTVALALLGHARKGLAIAAGRVMLGDLDILSLPPAQLRRQRGRRVAYVPQDPASGLNPARRIGWQVHEALSVHHDDLGDIGDIDARMQQVLAEVRLPSTPHFLRSFPHQLSGGQQQRVAIAMAFACRPQLIVMDEPTTGLDVTTQRHILETVRTLAGAYGVSTVYVSHDLPVVAEIAQRVAVMYAGRVVELGGATDVLGAPMHPYSVGLLNAAPTTQNDGHLVGIEGRPPRPGSWPPGCGFAPRCHYATAECTAAVPELAAYQATDRLVRCLRPGVGIKEMTERPAPIRVAAAAGALTVEDLVASHGARVVLHDVSFAIHDGTCVAVVGESGSGKTTLARSVVGMHTQWTGAVTFNGHALARSSRQREDLDRRSMQYVFQNPYTSLNPRRTIGEILDAPLRDFFDLPRATRADKVIAMLESLALDAGFLHRYPDELSGGERQRIAIGRALIVDPTLLICDEITSALDVSVQAVIVELLRDMRVERGMSMLFITHNLALVPSIAEQVVVLRDGVVVEHGPVERVLHEPADPYTLALLADASSLPQGARDPVAREPALESAEART